MIHLGEGTKERILKAVETAADFSPCLKPGASRSFFGDLSPGMKASSSKIDRNYS